MINTHGMIVTFGKHLGELWTRVPVSYLRWLANESNNYREIALSELERRGTLLDRSVELSQHAIDRASLFCIKVWHKTKTDDNEGLYSWLHRVSCEALEKLPEGETEVTHLGCKFAFTFGQYYPVLKTIINKNKKSEGL